jgi:glycosyltransferase involved in cell wall biosynthesis
MKILHLLYSGLGGHGNVFFSIVKADAKKEFEHIALFNGIENMREEYKERCQNSGIGWKFVKKKPGLDIRFYYRLIKVIRAKKPDILFLHGSTQIVWAWIATCFTGYKCRIIVRETQANHLKSKQDWFWLSLAMLLANKVVFLSDEYRADIHNKLKWLYRKRRITVIPNGIDLDRFIPVQRTGMGSFMVGMQARIVPIKDHVTLLHAFATVRRLASSGNINMRLVIAGDGECRADLEDLCVKLRISNHVEFLGMISESEIVHFLQGLDIYVHASFGETMSTAIMQAMACGLPVIASDVPGISNMIQDGKTGILVPVKNAEALEASLSGLIGSSRQREELGANARAYACQYFSQEKMFLSYKELFI